jgi:Amidases related to nicotinamidase
MQGLVVIDVQKAMFGASAPLNSAAVISRIADLLARARAAGVPVFYIQHDGGPDDAFDKNAPGFAFADEIAPSPADSITVKRRNSGFYETNLDEKLKAAGVDQLILCGMQTEYCVDATVRSAFERGYRVTVVADAHTTFDSQILSAATIIAHTQHIWNGRYARLKLAADVHFT